jgi:RecG-like helicase
MSSFELTSESAWCGRPIARKVRDVRPRSRLVVTGTICAAETVRFGGSPAYRVVLEDGTGELDALFLGRSTVGGLVVGARCSVEGTAQVTRGRLVVWNPLYKLESEDRPNDAEQNGQPRSTSPLAGMSSAADGESESAHLLERRP